MDTNQGLWLHGRVEAQQCRGEYKLAFDHFPPQATVLAGEFRPRPAADFLVSSCKDSAWRLQIGDTPVDAVLWETPKRTRTYPLARTYRLSGSRLRRIALIPIVKDEGSGANPDVLGIETIYWLTCFGIYVATVRYTDGRVFLRRDRNGEHAYLTDQRIDFERALNKIRRIAAPDITVEAWNRGEIAGFAAALEDAATAYEALAQRLRVPLHTVTSLRERARMIRDQGLASYVAMSDQRRVRSRHGEVISIQPKEQIIQNAGKVSLDILFNADYGAGTDVSVHLAPDEGWRLHDRIMVLEKKANPTTSDLMDALFKRRLPAACRWKSAVPVHFCIGATYHGRSGACWSLCPHHQRCAAADWRDCIYAPLGGAGNRLEALHRRGARELLREGAMNGFLTFVIGTDESVNAVQDTILRNLPSARMDSGQK